jgi:hypothetical protein
MRLFSEAFLFLGVNLGVNLQNLLASNSFFRSDLDIILFRPALNFVPLAFGAGKNQS